MSQQLKENAQTENKTLRKIRSFVRREGRMTKRQESGINDNWSSMGLEHASGRIDLETVFGRSAPLTVEIGFGMGRSFVEQAKTHLENNYIGIEVHNPGVGACLAEAAENKLTNVRVYSHDAVEILDDCIPEQSIDTLQLFFPDPWHKKRHHKRRIVQPEFVQTIRSKLKIGGLLHMATDWENYAEHMLEVMQAADGYKNCSATNDYVPRPEWRPLTKFEQRGHRLGHGVWDLIFERTQ